MYLRALLNVNVLEYATVKRCPGKPRLLAEYYTLLDIIVEDMGKDHHMLLHLEECFDNIKDDLDIPIGRSSVKAASDGQKKTGNESLDEVFEDAVEGLKIESPAAPPRLKSTCIGLYQRRWELTSANACTDFQRPRDEMKALDGSSIDD